MLIDLPKQAVHERHDLVRALRGESAHIVDQARDVVAVAVPKDSHGRNSARIVFVGDVPFGRSVGADAVQDFDFSRMGKVDLLAGVSDHLIGEDDDRRAIFFGEIKGLDGDVEAILGGGDGEHDDRMIAVSAPPGLHHIPLAHAGRQTGAGTAPHDVDDHTRDFRNTGEAKVLLHEREAGAAGGRHGLRPRQGSADRASHARDLVLHLNEGAACRRQAV